MGREQRASVVFGHLLGRPAEQSEEVLAFKLKEEGEVSSPGSKRKLNSFSHFMRIIREHLEVRNAIMARSRSKYVAGAKGGENGVASR